MLLSDDVDNMVPFACFQSQVHLGSARAFYTYALTRFSLLFDFGQTILVP